MGSPSARLKTRESLRPWLESGLEYVLNPGGVHVEEQPEVQTVPSHAHAQQPPVQHQPVQQAPVPQQTPPVQQQPVSQPQPQVQQTTQAPVQQPVAPPTGFPLPWSGFFKFAKPDAKVVWTYMELGLDLGGQPDPKRSGVLKNLQAHLRWPKGTINFWPVAALVDNALQPSTELFWKGWEQWRTPHIACFGQESLKVILPDADPNLTTHLLEHVTIYVLPAFTTLLTMLPHEQQISVEVLEGLRF